LEDIKKGPQKNKDQKSDKKKEKKKKRGGKYHDGRKNLNNPGGL